MKDPYLIKNVFSETDFKVLQEYATNLYQRDKTTFDKGFGRHQWALWGNSTPEYLLPLKYFHNKLLPTAKKEFGSETLKPSWCLLSIYEGTEARLWKHKDDNACTYHINLTVFAKTPWDFYVEGEKFTPVENEAVISYGNDQEHWREEFPDPENNIVCNAFFFYCEPEHWYFTEGPQYLYTNIRKSLNDENSTMSKM
jgi:hypothetical protein